MVFSIAELTRVLLRRWRFRFVVFEVRMWFFIEWPRLIFPELVSLKRFFAPRCDFCLGTAFVLRPPEGFALLRWRLIGCQKIPARRRVPRSSSPKNEARTVELMLPVHADRIRRKGFLDEFFSITLPNPGTNRVAAPCRRALEPSEPKPDERDDNAMPV